MKKLIYAFAATAALTLAACGGADANKSDNDSCANDSCNKECVEAQEAPAAVAVTAEEAKNCVEELKNAATEADATTLLQKAQAYATQLAQDGKLDEAKKYLEQAKDAVKDKYPQLVSVCDTAISAVEKVNAAAAVVDQANQAVENGKEAVNNAKEAASNAVDNAKAKGADALNKAANALKNN